MSEGGGGGGEGRGGGGVVKGRKRPRVRGQAARLQSERVRASGARGLGGSAGEARDGFRGGKFGGSA